MHLGKLVCRSHEKLHRLKNCHKIKRENWPYDTYSRCHMVRGGMNLTSMCLDCGRMLEDVERIVADTNYTQKKLYHIKY